MYIWAVRVDQRRLEEIITRLRARGTDGLSIEVKRAAGGVPNDLDRTLSAFANLPGGGLIILGLDEASGFSAVGVDDAARLEQSIASTARNALRPPVHVDFGVFEVEGAKVLVCSVDELPRAAKPCFASGNRAWLRMSDGDHELSQADVQRLYELRGEPPRWDAMPVDGSSSRDLDPGLVERFVEGVRRSSTRLRDAGDDEILEKRGVVLPDGRLSLAGLYVLGEYPQRLEPTLKIVAGKSPGAGAGAGTRTDNLVHIDGPVGSQLEAAVDWVAENIGSTIRFGPDGHGRDEPLLPLDAVRELIANALVHRELSPGARSQHIVIRLTQDRLIVTNPGGLVGMTVSRLGLPSDHFAVNRHVYDLASTARTARGARIIEGEGLGMHAVLERVAEYGLRAPEFIDQGLRFSAILPREAMLGENELAWLGSLHPEMTRSLTTLQRQLAVALARGARLTNSRVREEFDRRLTPEGVRAALLGLVVAGIAEQRGQRGGTEYRLAPGLVPIREIQQESIPIVELRLDGPLESESPTVRGRAHEPITKHGPVLIAELQQGRRSRRELVEATGLTARQVGYALTQLNRAGMVDIHGGAGRSSTTYSLPGD